jgi:quinolinate synthase
MDKQETIAEIHRLKEATDAFFLAHNYQIYDIQEIADEVGDSLELSQLAAQTDKPVILFCGVKFMAETAKVLSPDKMVLLPRLDAGCPMADMITPDELQRLREAHPEARVVTYVNSSVEIKAMSDICCTSSNALKIVKNIDADEIIFIPDRNLGQYIQSLLPEKKLILHEAYCYVHNRIKKSDLEKIRKAYPQAEVVVHPEVKPEVTRIADQVLSTGQMLRYVRQSAARQFIVGTEEGLLERMRHDNPAKTFLSPYLPRICVNMKRTTLHDVYLALKNHQYQINVDRDLADRARLALNKMIKYT